jgi:nucleoside-diphosphate-sugar epimerase
MKLFVTGATGAIGRYAVPALVAAGHEVTGVARSDQARVVGAAVGARSWVMLPGRLTKVLVPSMSVLARSQRVSNGKLRSLGWVPQYPSARESVAAILAAEASPAPAAPASA